MKISTLEFRPFVALLILAALFLFATTPVSAQTFTWIGPATGNGKFNVAADWAGGTAPSPTAGVSITAGSNSPLGELELTSSTTMVDNITNNAATTAFEIGSENGLTATLTSTGTITASASGVPLFFIGVPTTAPLTLSAANLAASAGGILEFGRSETEVNEELTGLSVSGTTTVSGTGADLSVSVLNSTGSGNSYTLGLLSIGTGGTVALNDSFTPTANTANASVTGITGTGGTIEATGLNGNGEAAENAILTIGVAASTSDATSAVFKDSGAGTNTFASTLAIVVNNASTGTQTFSGASTYSGGTTVSGGTLVSDNATALGTGAVTMNGGTLDLQASFTTPNNVLVTSSSTIQSDNATLGAGAIRTLGTLGLGAATLNIGEGSNATGSTAVVAFGATTLTANGTATINPTTADVTLTSVTGSTSSGTDTLDLDGTIAGNTISGIISDPSGGGNVAISKTNSSIWTVSGANTYSGGTTVSGGEFLANDAIVSTSSTGSGAVSVGSGGVLGGTGFVAPSGVTSGTAVDVSGKLSPGNGNEGTAAGVGALTFALSGTSSVKLETGSTFTFDLGTPAASDLIKIIGGSSTGALALNGQQITDFTFNQLTGFGAGTFTLFDTSATNDISGSLGATTTESLGNGFSGTLETGTDINGDEDLVLVVTSASVPEPSTLALLVASFAMLGLKAHRNWRQLKTGRSWI